MTEPDAVPSGRGLPPDHPDSCAQPRTGTRSHVLSAGSRAALLALSQERQVSLAHLLGTALAMVLQRYTNDTDLRFESVEPHGTGLAFDLTGDPSFEQALARVATTTNGSAERSPFAFGICTGNVGAEAPSPRANIDVALAAFIGATDVTLRWTYAAHRFDRSSVERLCNYYVRLLHAAIASPHLRGSGLPLMTGPERAQVIALGRGQVRPYEREHSVVQAFVRVARRTPHAIAIVADDTALSYAEVDARSNRLAHYLLSRGAGPRAAVGIALERGVDAPVAMLAVLKTGAAYVPLDLRSPTDRLGLMIEHAGIALVISTAASRELLAEHGAVILAVDDERDAIESCSSHELTIQAPAASRAYIMYTSGSTGLPKGVAVTHRGILRLVRNSDVFEIRDDDVFFQYAPLPFDASTLEIWGPLLNGARLAVPQPGLLSIDELDRALERYGVTTLWLTAAMFRTIVAAAPRALHGMRRLITGGDVVSPASARCFLATFPKTVLINGYGPTENTTFSTSYSMPSADAVGDRVPIGRPIANSTAYVLDRDRELVPIGVPGELYVGGDGVALGYVQQDDLTAERFVDDPFAETGGRMYRTGDRVRWRGDGLLDFLGRSDHQVKVRGYRIELEEVESALLTLDVVGDAAVVVTDVPGDKALTAFIVRAPGTRADEATLRAALARTLPPYMLPQRIIVLNTLPTHPSGKVDRIALVRSAESTAHATARSAAPGVSGTRAAGGNLRVVADIWREVLRLEEDPELDTNFFDAGGDSLLILTLQETLTRRLDVQVGVVDLFEYTTIRALTNFLARGVAH